MTSKAITDMVLNKKRYKWELNLGCQHNMPACYQLSYCEHHRQRHGEKSWWKKMENKIVYYKESVERPHLNGYTALLQNLSQIG
jgi:hypothetical protein